MNIHPIRRKNKDNPYILEKLDNKYIIKFMDSKKAYQIIDINEQIYNTFNQFELDDIKELHRYERHIEHSELYEETLYKRTFNKNENLDIIVINKILIDNLNEIINRLPNNSKRRIIMYYYQNMTLEEIAHKEGISHQAVSKSIKESIIKIRKIIKI